MAARTTTPSYLPDLISGAYGQGGLGYSAPWTFANKTGHERESETGYSTDLGCFLLLLLLLFFFLSKS